MSPSNPEAEARESIDYLLKMVGWRVVNHDQVNIRAADPFQPVAVLRHD